MTRWGWWNGDGRRHGRHGRMMAEGDGDGRCEPWGWGLGMDSSDGLIGVMVGQCPLAVQTSDAHL